MKDHPENLEVQQAACSALWNLCTENSKNHDRVADSGAIELVLSAMQTFSTSAGLQEEACGVLGNLAGKSAHQLQIASAGGIDAIVAAMKAHETIVGVQKQACGALGNLATENAANQSL